MKTQRDFIGRLGAGQKRINKKQINIMRPMNSSSSGFDIVNKFVILCLVAARLATAGEPSIESLRVPITGADVNPPDPFEGWGGTKHGMGWPGGLIAMPNGDLLFFHSAGYWHSSMPTPYKVSEELDKRWSSNPWFNWPYKGTAPRGGRIMMCRSSDGGRTWSKPETVLDTPFDERSTGVLRCDEDSLVCFAVVQGRWAGFTEAPAEFRGELDGLGGKTCVVRSTNNGKTWSEPAWMESPGKFQENGQGKPIFLPGGAMLWLTYCQDTSEGYFFGAIHRSDDCGKTWRTASIIKREKENLDEAAITRLADGRLMIVCRPDGGILFSKDEGKTWKESGQMVDNSRRQKKPDMIATPDISLVAAPQLMVLKDGTVVCLCSHPPAGKHHGLYAFLSKDSGVTWSKALPIAPESYGYPADLKLKDDSILVAYLTSAMPPARMYLAHFKVNEKRDNIQLLPIAAQLK